MPTSRMAYKNQPHCCGVVLLLSLFTVYSVAVVLCDPLKADDNQPMTAQSSGLVEEQDNTNLKMLPLTDQVNLLQKQLSALMTRRREDYKLLENNLKKYIRDTATQFSDVDIQAQLHSLREEVKRLREPLGPNKERLTVQWLSQSIAELRQELAELQESSSNTSKESFQRRQSMEEVRELRSEIHNVKLELESLRSRQSTVEQQIIDLQSEAEQSAEDLRKTVLHAENNENQKTIPGTIDFVEPEADHRMRHQKFLRQQVHSLEKGHRKLKQDLKQLKAHNIDARLGSLEKQQRHLANLNFNLSREVASLDKMHTSMLELLEDVEGIQTKFDKAMPDVRREISKLEFNFAQLNSEQGLLREEGRNLGKSIQAIAVSVSTLQEDRDTIKKLQDRTARMENEIGKIQLMRRPAEQQQQQQPINSHHQRTEQIESSKETTVNMSDWQNLSSDQKRASELVQKLEKIESEYENIVNKLPDDCSQVNVNSNADEHHQSAYYLIAPQGQQHPIMAQCVGEWTVIQKRYDGSVDFNRSWDEYSNGFGSPTTEFWIGNEKLYHLTQDNCTKLRIEMQDIYDNYWYADYGFFKIESRDSGYRIIISDYSGNASDALNYQNHMEFSSIDIDRDISNTNCAGNYEGGWWFSHCQHANLNGRYNLGLTWFDSSRNEWIAVKSSTMLLTKDQTCLSESFPLYESSSESTTTPSTPN